MGPKCIQNGPRAHSMLERQPVNVVHKLIEVDRTAQILNHYRTNECVATLASGVLASSSANEKKHASVKKLDTG